MTKKPPKYFAQERPGNFTDGTRQTLLTSSKENAEKPKERAEYPI
nr:hypothetical protein [Candidatus Njordarchaeota archaeon]